MKTLFVVLCCLALFVPIALADDPVYFYVPNSYADPSMGQVETYCCNATAYGQYCAYMGGGPTGQWGYEGGCHDMGSGYGYACEEWITGEMMDANEFQNYCWGTYPPWTYGYFIVQHAHTVFEGAELTEPEIEKDATDIDPEIWNALMVASGRADLAQASEQPVAEVPEVEIFTPIEQ